MQSQQTKDEPRAEVKSAADAAPKKPSLEDRVAWLEQKLVPIIGERPEASTEAP